MSQKKNKKKEHRREMRALRDKNKNYDIVKNPTIK
jgi:hypothetical protein